MSNPENFMLRSNVLNAFCVSMNIVHANFCSSGAFSKDIDTEQRFLNLNCFVYKSFWDTILYIE